MTLRAKLALLFGALGLFVSVLVGGLAYRATSAELVSTVDSFLSTRADEIAGGSRGTPGGGRGNRRDEGTRLPFDADALTQLVTRNGTVTSDSDGLPITENVQEMIDLAPGDRGRPAVRFDDIVIDGESYRMISRALPSGGAVQVARSTEEPGAVRSALVARFALIAFAVAVLAALLGWIIARRTTSPLRRLADVAAEVAATSDFTTDVDVSRTDEIGQLATSFRSMLDALEQSREQQHRLVLDAGHELRTPLTSLRANVELLERATELPAEERREVVGAIKSELIELGDLFTELIELATDSRSAELDAHPVGLDELVHHVADKWQRRVDRPVVVSPPTPGVFQAPAVVNGDAAMLERAVDNLVGNADKFSPPGTPIELVSAGGRVAVRDRGPGVPPADRSRIFDRFHRAETARSMPGSGLGLAIVAQIVERHGGTTFVGDAPDGGAEIGFELPLASPSSEGGSDLARS